MGIMNRSIKQNKVNPPLNVVNQFFNAFNLSEIKLLDFFPTLLYTIFHSPDSIYLPLSSFFPNIPLGLNTSTTTITTIGIKAENEGLM